MRAREFVSEMSISRAKRRKQTRLEFKGYRCTKDCSGHKAGYLWAKLKGIGRTQDCNFGNSKSFWEGCKACAQGR